jgi:FdhE protein
VQRRIDDLRRDNPTFGPWLTVVELALAAAADPAWREAGAAAMLVEVAADRPALDGATFSVDGRLAAGLIRRLLEAAAPGEVEGLGALRAAAREVDPARWLGAALAGERAPIGALAATIDVPPEVVAPLVELAALPLLFAARERCASRAEGWTHGHCPVCGHWPTLAELRGLDRARRLRCGHCGGDWGLNPLLCVYCGNDDHQKLTALVPEKGRESRRVDACLGCRGYLKAVASLGALAPELIPLEDLATVELDVVALEREYHRPEEVERARARLVVR